MVKAVTKPISFVGAPLDAESEWVAIRAARGRFVWSLGGLLSE